MISSTQDEDVHVMIDLETLGIKPGCKILAIGACKMYTEAPLSELDTFHFQLDQADQDQYGLKQALETQIWWTRQSQEAQDYAFAGKQPLKHSLARFNSWVGSIVYDRTKLFVWAKSPSFDCMILKEAFERVGIQCPWDYYNERDLRTLTHLVGGFVPEPAFSGIQHQALADAVHQANWAEKCQEFMRIGVQGYRTLRQKDLQISILVK